MTAEFSCRIAESQDIGFEFMDKLFNEPISGNGAVANAFSPEIASAILPWVAAIVSISFIFALILDAH